MTGPDDEVYVSGVGGPPPPPCCSFRSMATLRYNSDGSNPWTVTYFATSQRGVGLALARDNGIYVAGDYMLTVIKYVQTTTAVSSEESTIPTTLKLLQNYPNPFNPSTTIRFDIPQSGLVSLKLFDVLGREVESLVNEEKSAGSYSVSWDARNVGSGMYFCKLECNGQIETKKMVLVK